MQIRFKTRPDGQLPGLPVDQKLYVLDLWETLDAGGIQADLIVAEGDGRLADVREELPANNLKLIQAECMPA